MRQRDQKTFKLLENYSTRKVFNGSIRRLLLLSLLGPCLSLSRLDVPKVRKAFVWIRLDLLPSFWLQFPDLEFQGLVL